MNDTLSWYQTLQKPSWSPADNVFGIVWGLLYPIIIAVNIYILQLVIRGRLDWRLALPFWLNLFFNLIFTPIQFGLKNNLLATVDILLILGTIIWAMITIWPQYRWITLAFTPYLLWVIIATVLQCSITWLNR